MKAIFLLFISLLIYNIIFSQDVIVFVQAKHEINPIELDTIFIENLSNGTTAKLYDLPIGVTNYEINLSQGAQVNAIGQINEPLSNFVLLSNKPGVCSFQIQSKPLTDISFNLYNIHGQRLYHETRYLSSAINTFEFYNSYANIGVLKITTSDNSYSIKVIGDETHTTKISSVSCHLSNTSPTIKSLKSDFSFNVGDTICISAKKLSYHSNSVFVEPISNENYIIYLSQPCTGHETVTDYNGNIYNTVQIGNQCWMKENLKSTHYDDGTALIDGTGIQINYDYESRYWFDYDDNPTNSQTFGKLYTWAAAIDGYVSNDEELIYGVRQGLCPNGWHIPSDSDWFQLESYIDTTITELHITGLRGFDAGLKLKTTNNWVTNTGTNQFGFSALPSGQYFFSESNSQSFYSDLGLVSIWWSANTGAYYRKIWDDANGITRNTQNPAHGYSIRCLKD